MIRQSVPVVVVASALLVSETVAVLARDSMWMLAVGALLYALALVGADVLVSRKRAASPAPSREALLLALAFLLSCGITMVFNSDQLAMLIPLLGGGAATPILLRGHGGCTPRPSRTIQ